MLLQSLCVALAASRCAARSVEDEKTPFWQRLTKALPTRGERRDRMALWQRGIHAIPDHVDVGAYARHARLLPVLRHRGGADCSETGCDVGKVDYGALTRKLGPAFAEALRENEREHRTDCAKSCEKFYCGAAPSKPWRTRSVSMGSVPPEDFATEFAFPLDLIKVTTEPVVSPAEAARAIALARAENVDINEYTSGKYKLGGDWLSKMDNTRNWFNEQLEQNIFPAIAASFPEVVSNVSTLRAHSVAVLKYNSTHPRTDVHIDNGVLALTLALSPQTDYEGGGTFFEHLGEDALVEMDAGHATWRPGSVRHGGHRVSRGERYIIGAFLLLEDRVEHVRRLKNRGAKLRTKGDLNGATQLFEWALAINAKCATCMKDLSELRSSLADMEPQNRQAHLNEAEAFVRRSLDLLPSDSDALFNLGLVLSKKGDSAGALKAYEASAAVNADDVELLYNLAMKYGEANRRDDEVQTYRKALLAQPSFGKARCNLGAALAETGDLDGALAEFLEAVRHDPTSPTPWQNLAVLYHKQGVSTVQGLQQCKSKEAAVDISRVASRALGEAHNAWRKVMELVDDPRTKAETVSRLAQVLQLRGRAVAIEDPAAALPHFLEATQLVPTEPSAWEALAKVYAIVGDQLNAQKASALFEVLMSLAPQRQG